jgi:Putative zinc-finger
MTVHTDVGAYSMGLLEEQDKRAFEEHLAGCPACAAELAELSPMAALLKGMELKGMELKGMELKGMELRGVDPAGEEPAGAKVTDLIARRARQQRHRRRWQVALGAAAGIVLIGGGIGLGIAAAPEHAGPPAPALALTGQLHSATDPGTGVAGTVGLVAKAWGTQVTLDLSQVRGPVECELIAVSRTGERRVVMGWLVAAPGDGVPGHPAHLVIRGATSIPRNDLARVDVDVVNGRTLVTIPV